MPLSLPTACGDTSDLDDAEGSAAADIDLVSDAVTDIDTVADAVAGADADLGAGDVKCPPSRSFVLSANLVFIFVIKWLNRQRMCACIYVI